MKSMKSTALIGADEIATTLNVSKAFAYQLIRNLNAQLRERGYITIAGRVSRRFFMERFYGFNKEEVVSNAAANKEDT